MPQYRVLGLVFGVLALAAACGEVEQDDLRPGAAGTEFTDESSMTTRAALQGDPTQPQCGFTVVEPPGGVPVDPCLSGPTVTTIFGPEQVTRTNGAPNEFSASFNVPEGGGTCLRAANDGIASARIAIDDEEVFSPEDFNPNVPALSARLDLSAGGHALDVRLASKPGSSITVDVRFAPDVLPQAELILGDQGLVGLHSVFDDPDPFSPAGMDGLSTTTTFSLTGSALKTPGAPSGKYDFLLRAYFEVADDSLCGPVVTLLSETSVEAASDAPLTAVWDGRDGDGVLVGEGTYYYRATVELVRKRISNGDEEVLDTATSEIQAVRIGDPFGLEGKTTRELNVLIAPIKASVDSYDDLDLVDQRYFDALVRARAARRSQLPVENRFELLPHDSGPRYYPGKAARPFFRGRRWARGVILIDGAPHWKFSTRNLRPPSASFGQAAVPPDPAMVVRDLVTGQAYFNDDCWIEATPGGGGFFIKASCVTISAPTDPAEQDRQFEVTVFASPEHKENFGIFNLYINDELETAAASDHVRVNVNHFFGGEVIDLDASGLPDGRYAFQTVHIPNGADDTQLVYYRSGWQEGMASDDEGIEEAARIATQKHAGDRLLLGAYSWSTMGLTSVVINDCVYSLDARLDEGLDCCPGGSDDDLDCLSNELEAELGTYAESVPGLDEAPPIPGHDTDRDGLWDYYEVIGRKAPDGSEQEIKRLGADPLRKDIFIEYDRHTATTWWPGAAKIDAAEKIYEDLPRLAEHSPNPDGSEGVAFHADVGQPCDTAPNPVVCQPSLCPNRPDRCRYGCATLCGDWGGADTLTDADVDVTGNSTEIDVAMWYTRYGPQGWINWMSGARYGVFRYGWFVHFSGMAGHRRPSFRDDRIGGGEVTAHELGHNFGLDHWGEPIEDESPYKDMNHMAAYPSLMNYNYGDAFKVFGWATRPRFSEGRLDTIFHYALNESGYSLGASKEHFRYQPFYYDVVDDTVDWNHDGRISNQPVQFDTAPVDRPYTARGWPDLYQYETLGDRAPTGGGAIAVQPIADGGRDARVWVFAPFDHTPGVDGGVYPDYLSVHDMTPAVGGEPVEASEFHAWSEWSEGVAFDGHPDGEVAAYFVGGAPGYQRILLVFPDRAGQLHYRLFNPLDPPGAATWQPIEPWPAGTRARNATLAAVGSDIVLVYRDIAALDSAEHIYLDRFNPTTGWDEAGPRLQHHDSNLLRSLYTPGIAELPNGDVYMAVVHPDTKALLFYRRSGDDLWVSADDLGLVVTGIPSGPHLPELRQRVTLLFLPFRQGDDEVLPDGSGYLAAYWSTGRHDTEQGSWYHRRAYTTGFASPASRNWDGVRGPPKGWHSQQAEARPYADHSPHAARRWLDAASIYTSSVWDQVGPDAMAPLAYLPFSNGTPPQAPGIHRDTDDAKFIADNLCVSLQSLVDICRCDSLAPEDACPGVLPMTSEPAECSFGE